MVGPSISHGKAGTGFKVEGSNSDPLPTSAECPVQGVDTTKDTQVIGGLNLKSVSLRFRW